MSENERPKDELGSVQEEDEARPPVGQLSDGGYEEPLFLKGRSDGHKGDAQDEKDETGE